MSIKTITVKVRRNIKTACIIACFALCREHCLAESAKFSLTVMNEVLCCFYCRQ